VRGFFYGMTIHELDVETRCARAELEHLFMLIVFGDLIGHLKQGFPHSPYRWIS